MTLHPSACMYAYTVPVQAVLPGVSAAHVELTLFQMSCAEELSFSCSLCNSRQLSSSQRLRSWHFFMC